MGLRLALAEESPPEDGKRYGNRGIPSAQCRCGRFAKTLSLSTRYNGAFDLHWLKVDCSRCGVVEYSLT